MNKDFCKDFDFDNITDRVADIEQSMLKLEGMLVNCLDSEGLGYIADSFRMMIRIINSRDRKEIRRLVDMLNKNVANINQFLEAMDSPFAEEAFLKVLQNGVFTV